MQIDELPTPALLLDLDILERNLSRMQKRIDSLGSSLRPHVKTHKCVEIANRQRQLGCRGITVSTFYEAEQFARAGFNDITWAFPIPAVYTSRVAKLAETITLRIVVDSMDALEYVGNTARSSGIRIHVWLKVDCGYHRAGVDPDSSLAEQLVRSLSESKVLAFDGILSHSGHAYYGKNRMEILAVANQERTVMTDFAERMRRKGYQLPAVSIGSTPAISVIDNLEGISEVRPGNYCFFDQTMVDLGVCGVEDCAVTVLASVISHQPGASHVVVDAGALALSKDTGVSKAEQAPVMGVLFEDYGKKSTFEKIALRTLSQEHGKILAEKASFVDGRFRVGERVRILENHSCLTVPHFPGYNVVRGTEVIDRWSIFGGRTSV
ncbi:MAG TPA: alanine racemase [Bacteroidota bacterium]